MGMSVRTNTSAINTKRNLNKTNRKLSKSIEKLASGFQINRSADDASGLAISEKMRAQITSLDTYVDNAENGISLIQTAEGAMDEIGSMLQRGVELSERAANGIFTDSERKMIQSEINQLQSEIDRISDTTKFNDIYILKGNSVTTDGKYIPPRIEGDLPSWAAVDSASLGSNSLAHTYVDSNGDKHSATILDFSSFSPSDINSSVDKGFYTTCCTCSNHYSIKFTNDASSSVSKSGNHYIYNVSLANAQTADDIYNEIINVTGGQPNSHYTNFEIINDGGTNKLMLYDNRKDVKPSAASGYGVFGAGVAYDAKDTSTTLTPGVSINVGFNKPGKIYIPLPDVSVASLELSSVSVLNTESAANSMSTFRKAINTLSSKRADMGAFQNRLEYTINNLSVTSENMSSSKSRIKDTDMAKEMMKYTQQNIILQSAQSFLSQANSKTQNVLQLLQ